MNACIFITTFFFRSWLSVCREISEIKKNPNSHFLHSMCPAIRTADLRNFGRMAKWNEIRRRQFSLCTVGRHSLLRENFLFLTSGHRRLNFVSFFFFFPFSTSDNFLFPFNGIARLLAGTPISAKHYRGGPSRVEKRKRGITRMGWYL